MKPLLQYYCKWHMPPQKKPWVPWDVKTNASNEVGVASSNSVWNLIPTHPPDLGSNFCHVPKPTIAHACLLNAAIGPDVQRWERMQNLNISLAFFFLPLPVCTTRCNIMNERRLAKSMLPAKTGIKHLPEGMVRQHGTKLVLSSWHQSLILNRLPRTLKELDLSFKKSYHK